MKRILVVNDGTYVRSLLEQTLKRKDYEIQAGTGKDVLSISRKERPDLILMDLRIPGGLDEIKAMRMLKSDVRTKQLKVIILTSSGNLRDEAMDAGADAYLYKPFSPMELLQKVDELMGEI